MYKKNPLTELAIPYVSKKLMLSKVSHPLDTLYSGTAFAAAFPKTVSKRSLKQTRIKRLIQEPSLSKRKELRQKYKTLSPSEKADFDMYT